jgi:hypothetical protein
MSGRTVCLAIGLLIEPLESGVALVFDPNTGSTTLINGRALMLVGLLRGSDAISETALRSQATQVLPDASDLPEILSSLEKSRLVVRS